MSEIKTELLQAILLNNIDKIQQYYVADAISHGRDLIDPYHNIIALRDENSALSIGKMLALPNEVVEVYNTMTPLERSFLYPKINLYKLNSNNEYTEIKLKNHFDDQQLNLLKSEKIAEETILNADEAFSVGLQSIHIQNRPEREGDVNIKVVINFVFENILALLQTQTRDLISVPLNIDNVNFQDYRLKLVIGWSAPNDYSASPVITPIFKNAMEYSEEVYLLQIYKHEINFASNGAVELEIEYGAAIEGYFQSSSSDILNIDNALTQKTGIISNLFGLGKAQMEFNRFPEYVENFKRIEVLKERLKDIDQDPSALEAKQIENLNKEIGELQEKNLKYSKFLKKIRYGYILKSLYESNKILALQISDELLEGYNNVAFNLETDETKIKNNQTIKSALEFFFKEPIGDIVKVGSIDVEGIKELSDKETDLKSDDVEKKTTEDLDSFNKANKDGLKVEVKLTPEQELIALGQEGRKFGANVAAQVLQAAGLKETASKVLSTLDPSKRPIYFIKLGDLFDAAATFIEKKEEYNIIFGTVEFYDYKTQKINTVNITDIPISLEHFSMWFINTVIKPQLDSYYFKNFIEDVIKTLLSPLFGFFYDGIKTTLSAVTFNSQIITSTVKIKEHNISTDKIKGLLVDKNKKEKNFFQYYVIYATILENKDLKGDEKEDIEKGIYHYKIGSSAGMLTDIKFIRIDFEKLRDARIVSQNLNTAGALLREHYNCDLSLVGNPLFQNGRLFYIDGSHYGLLGRKATESIGLGGYYLVHGIEHVFENGNWKMDVHGIFNSPRFGAYGNLIGGKVVSENTINSLKKFFPDVNLDPGVR